MEKEEEHKLIKETIKELLEKIVKDFKNNKLISSRLTEK